MAFDRERRRFLDFLRQQGLRVTAERRALFEEVFSRHGHLDAEQLLEAMRGRGAKISRATVYRSLDLLVACGLVRRYRLGRNRHLYEHVHAGQRHDHLVCRRCGRVVEFVSPGILAMQAEICRAHGFLPSDHHLTITSLCGSCAAAEADASTPAGSVSES
jgi:Fur family ferric uptake transcriptional regulator